MFTPLQDPRYSVAPRSQAAVSNARPNVIHTIIHTESWSKAHVSLTAQNTRAVTAGSSRRGLRHDKRQFSRITRIESTHRARAPAGVRCRDVTDTRHTQRNHAAPPPPPASAGANAACFRGIQRAARRAETKYRE